MLIIAPTDIVLKVSLSALESVVYPWETIRRSETNMVIEKQSFGGVSMFMYGESMFCTKTLSWTWLNI